MGHSTFPRSGVLVLGPNYVQSLLPSTLVSQAESLLESHRIEDAVDLADQQRKRLQGNVLMDEDEAEELCYVYQRIGFQCFSETLFEDAGKNFLAGELDPRVLVSYFPELRGCLFDPADVIDIFAGVAEHLPPEQSVDDIIVTNLVRNYSPHLTPNTRSAPPTAELRKILGITAKDMLEVFLRKCRSRGRANQSSVDAQTNAVNQVIDTVLAKLFAQSEKTTDLYALLQEPNDILLSEIENVFQEAGQYGALCAIYKQRGDNEKLLEAWSKLVEGQWTDDDVRDPLSSMLALLTEKRDRTLTQKWGIWLTKKDPERALKLLTSKDSTKRRTKTEDDFGMLRQITEADPVAGAQYLEYLVLQKRSTARELHMQLATTCIDQLLTCIADESVSKLWRAKASSYSSSRSETSGSFLSYFASTTPNSDHKRVRLKTILFLQGSTLYDPAPIRRRLLEHQKILHLELAIIDGKLGNHRAALATLVQGLRDAISAEAYCTLGGEVVPAKTAQFMGEQYGLQLWASSLFSSPAATTKSAASKMLLIEKQKSVNDDLKKDLLKILLEVYMSDGAASADRTSRLLNSQAVNLDVVDVVSLVPPDWPLNTMSTFLARSFRRTLHARHEGKIVKAICAGQNLCVADQAWLVLREHGAIVEEAADDDDEDRDEKAALSEKLALHLQDIQGSQTELTGMRDLHPNVVEIASFNVEGAGSDT